MSATSPTACARNGTVVAVVLGDDPPSALLPLAASAEAFGFPCIVVQPFAPLSQPWASPRLLMLMAPQPPLLPRSRWCNSSAAYTARRIELHRMRMWMSLLEQGLSVFGLGIKNLLLRDPLPAIAAMRTRAGTIPAVLGHTPGWFAKHFYLSSPFFVRATPATRALLRAAAARVRGAHEDVVFSEELNFGAGSQAACCHTECLGKGLVGTAAVPPRRTPPAAAWPPSPPMLDTDARVESSAPAQSRHWPNGAQCRARGLTYDDVPPLAPAPPNATANRWPRDPASGELAAFGARRYGTTAKKLPLFQLAWRPDAFNTLHVPLHRFGRCTGRTESCVGVHPSCPPPPPPFDVVLAGKKAAVQSSRTSRRRKKASKVVAAS